MNARTSKSEYERRLARVRDYIYDHLDDDLDFARLAEIACLSPHHWHRIYRALHGETIFETVRRLRLQRAAGELTQTSASIADIAARAGYDSVAAFTRAFKPAYGLPPARYRLERTPPLPKSEAFEETTMRDIRIENTPAYRLAGIEHRGSYMEIGRAFDALHAHFTQRNLYRPDQKMIAVYFDDPASKPPSELRALAAVSVGDDSPIDPPLVAYRLAAGEYAVLRHRGPYAELGAAYDRLYGGWLPQSGREAADAPAYEVYFNTPMTAAPKDLITDIYLPLHPK